MPDYRISHAANAPFGGVERMSGNAQFLRLSGTDLGCVRGGQQVFSGVSFAVCAGEALALTGPNGAGKTTLLRVIAGLLRLSEGRLEISGGESEATIAEQVHYVGHQDALKPALSVAENLAFWTGFLGEESAAADGLAAVGLAALADLPAGYLSAGQRRRLALARLVSAPRKIWLLDEPTAALDAAAQVKLGELMGEHLGGGGIVIAATHGPLPIAHAAELGLGAR
jgi:heme exporter protein A